MLYDYDPPVEDDVDGRKGEEHHRKSIREWSSFGIPAEGDGDKTEQRGVNQQEYPAGHEMYRQSAKLLPAFDAKDSTPPDDERRQRQPKITIDKFGNDYGPGG